jgi:hypothetical protein
MEYVTSQECSECRYVSPTNRDPEEFICQECDHHEDADVDAAKVILQRGLDGLGIYLDLYRESLGNRLTLPSLKAWGCLIRRIDLPMQNYFNIGSGQFSTSVRI